MSKENIYFITFGGGGKNYIDAGERLIRQAQKTGFFTKTILYTDQQLKNDQSFWSQHGDFIMTNKRGYGYWLWKPYIIKKTMETMNDGDILLYLDSGCEIGGSKNNILKKYLDLIKNYKILFNATDYVEGTWDKMDLIDYLKITDRPEILTSGQHEAGAIMLLVCDSNKKLITDWYSISNNYHLIDDSPSNKPNLPNFREHRHDQSVFSLLTKKNNIRTKFNTQNCVHCIRNRTGQSTIKLETFISNDRKSKNNSLIIFIILLLIIIIIILIITIKK